MARTVTIPDYDGGWLPVTVPEPGEDGYLTAAQRTAAAPGDPWPPLIAREQAIAEHLEREGNQPAAEPEAG